jgi:hypothetical protein
MQQDVGWVNLISPYSFAVAPVPAGPTIAVLPAAPDLLSGASGAANVVRLWHHAADRGPLQNDPAFPQAGFVMTAAGSLPQFQTAVTNTGNFQLFCSVGNTTEVTTVDSGCTAVIAQAAIAAGQPVVLTIGTVRLNGQIVAGSAMTISVPQTATAVSAVSPNTVDLEWDKYDADAYFGGFPNTGHIAVTGTASNNRAVFTAAAYPLKPITWCFACVATQFGAPECLNPDAGRPGVVVPTPCGHACQMLSTTQMRYQDWHANVAQLESAYPGSAPWGYGCLLAPGAATFIVQVDGPGNDVMSPRLQFAVETAEVLAVTTSGTLISGGRLRVDIGPQPSGAGTQYTVSVLPADAGAPQTPAQTVERLCSVGGFNNCLNFRDIPQATCLGFYTTPYSNQCAVCGVTDPDVTPSPATADMNAVCDTFIHDHCTQDAFANAVECSCVNRGTSSVPVDFRGTHVTYQCFPAYICNSYGLIVPQEFMDNSECWWGNCARGEGLRPSSYSTCSQDFDTCLTAINGYVAPGVTVDTSCPGFDTPPPAAAASGPGLCPILVVGSPCYCPPEQAGCPGYVPPTCEQVLQAGCPGYVPPECPSWVPGCPGYTAPSPQAARTGLSSGAVIGIVVAAVVVVAALAIGLGVHFSGAAKRRAAAAAVSAPDAAPAAPDAAPAAPDAAVPAATDAAPDAAVPAASAAAGGGRWPRAHTRPSRRWR